MVDKEFMVAFAIAAVVVVAIRLLANTNTLLGRICRWWWNASFKLVAHIPFFGWMAHFIIGTEKEKQPYIDVGKQVDKMASDAVAAAAERQKAEEKARLDLQNELISRIGRNDIYVSSANAQLVRIGNKEYSMDDIRREYGML